MSEPRYPARVGDPDETTRIPKDALDGLRDSGQSREQGFSGSAGAGGPGGAGAAPGSGGSAGSGGPPGSSGSSGPNGSGSPGSSGAFHSRSSGLPSSGSGVPVAGSSTPPPRSESPSGSAPGTSRVPGVNGYPSDGSPAASPPGGSGASGRTAAFGGPGSFGSAGPVGSPAAGAAGFGSSGSGYAGRSETGYSPSSYPSPYASAYPSLGEPPTAVAGPGRSSVGAGPGTGGATAARSALGTAATRPPTRGGPSGPRPARRARLLVRHIDPWSTLKFSFVLSVAMFFVWLVAVGVLYGVLDGMGVFEQINGLYDEVSGNTGDRLFSPGLVLGTATLIGAVNIVLFTALATIGAFVYNICSDLVGGIEVTLAERD